jgi:hypothetical protein
VCFSFYRHFVIPLRVRVEVVRVRVRLEMVRVKVTHSWNHREWWTVALEDTIADSALKGQECSNNTKCTRRPQAQWNPSTSQLVEELATPLVLLRKDKGP